MIFSKYTKQFAFEFNITFCWHTWEFFNDYYTRYGKMVEMCKKCKRIINDGNRKFFQRSVLNN